MTELELQSVFQDTVDKSEKTTYGKTTKHYNSEIGGPYGKNLSDNITVENSDTVTSLTKWSESDRTCAINMASYKRPGGGVERGAKAQEECLFRCSNLTHSISKDFYPLMDDSCLYTEGSLFFKDKNYDMMKPVKCDVMTIAAINLNKFHHFYNPQKGLDYESTTLDKIRLMLSVPAKYGAKNIILGAWGCGVFKNDPDRMSEFFKNILVDEGYSRLYNQVVFAIINDHNSVGSNYEIFKKRFS